MAALRYLANHAAAENKMSACGCNDAGYYSCVKSLEN